MTTCSISLDYTLTESTALDARPRFVIDPDSGDDHHVRLSATNLRSVDQLELRWSTTHRMKQDPVKAYLAQIGSKGGSKKSKAKTEAARVNAKKGGRPKGAKDSKPRVRSAARS